MRLSEGLKLSVSGVWSSLLDHPFVVELYSGTLPMEKFRYYVLQDYNYLIGLTRALSLAASRAPRVEWMRMALELAHGTITGEMENYERLLGRIGLSLEEAARTKPNFTNATYMAFMASTCSLQGFYECMSSLLPCFWSYSEIAERHRGRLEENRVEVYRDWASVYLSREYLDLVEKLRGIIDESPLGLESLKPYFEIATRYELEFWEASYRMKD